MQRVAASQVFSTEALQKGWWPLEKPAEAKTAPDAIDNNPGREIRESALPQMPISVNRNEKRQHDHTQRDCKQECAEYEDNRNKHG